MRASLLFLVNLRRSPRLASPRVSARSLARPLQLYRYESVAASEEAADRRSERSDGKRR